MCLPAGHQLVQRPLQASIVVQSTGTLPVRGLGTLLLRKGLAPAPAPSASLPVYLARTAGLDKLITVNCVPPLHNQLM